MFKLNTRLSIQPSIVALSLVSLIVMMGSSMVTPSLTLFAEGFGANEFLVGAAIAGFAIGRLVFDVPAGFLTERVGISRAMILGLGVLVGSSALAGLAPSYWVLLVARIFEGVGSSIYVSAAIVFVLLSSEPARRGRTMGTYQSILMLGPIVGPVFGAPIAIMFGYNAPYFAFAGIIFAALIFILVLSYRNKFKIDRESEPEKAESQSRVVSYLTTASIATFGFAFLRSGVYTTGMPLFAYGNLELSVFDVGIILTMASLANLAGSFFSGRLTQAYGMQRPLFAAILFSAALVALMPLSAAMVHLLAIVTLLGVASGFFGQSIAWAADQIEEKVRKDKAVQGAPALGVQSHVTRGIGFNRMIGDLGLILGPLFVGYFISMFAGDWIIPFAATSAVLAVASVFIARR